jgi:Spy/CpxP family protein refolding chaperone
MTKILAAVVAALVAMSFSVVVFAAGAAKSSAPKGEAKKSLKQPKKETQIAREKRKKAEDDAKTAKAERIKAQEDARKASILEKK